MVGEARESAQHVKVLDLFLDYGCGFRVFPVGAGVRSLRLQDHWHDGFGAEYGGYGAQNKDAQGATVVVGGLVLHAKLAGPDADVSHLGLGESAEEPGAVVVLFDVGKVAVQLYRFYLVL